MLVKQDSCRLNNTDSYYTVSCNFEIVECIIFIGKGIPPNKHANFCLYHYYFALSYDVASGSEITSYNKICKPLVVNRFTGNVMTSITTLRTL